MGKKKGQKKDLPQNTEGASGKQSSQQERHVQQRHEIDQGILSQKSKPSDTRPPRQQQGAGDGQSIPPRQQQGAGDGQSIPPRQQQGAGDGQSIPPRQQQGAWGGPSAPPRQQQGAGGGQSAPPRQQQGAGDGQSMPPRQQYEGKKESSEASLSQLPVRFAPKIYANKKSGTPITVAANFFPLIISNPNIIVYHYNVIMEPDKPKSLLRAVWNKFMSVTFPNRLTAFDGKNAYSNGPLLDGDTCTGTVKVLNENNVEKEFNVTIEKVRTVSLMCFHRYREKMLTDSSMKVLPEAEMSVLDIIMKNWACDNFVSSGKNFFTPSAVKSQNSLELSARFDIRFGYFQSAFLGYTPYLIFDVAHKPFYRSCCLLDVLQCFEDKYGNKLDEVQFNYFIRTVKIQYEVPGDPSRRVFRVNKLVGNANTQTFRKDDGTEITVAQYFAKEKKYKIRYPNLPLLWVGSTQKSVFVPMELCKILPDQIFRGMLDSKETREMIRMVTTNAIVRSKKVQDVFHKAQINSQPLMKEFGLRVSNEMEKVPARVLDPPTLKTTVPISVREGVWRTRNFLEPVTLKRWCVLNADKYVRKENIIRLQNTIKTKAADFSMKVEEPKRDPMDIEPKLASLKAAFSQLKDMEMVFVIIPETKGLYSKVKTICETQEGVLTQCLKSRTVNQDPRMLGTTVGNILLKVNSKLGGKNHTFNNNSIPSCLKGLTMIIGADVTHASPGTKIPSVAAVAVSCDAASFQYGITIRVQPKGEIIRDLKEIISIHLKKFHEIRKSFPEKIIFFRDGVSEGELPKVFKSELMAVQSACAGRCQPKITLVIVQKRHHTRFFPTRKEDEQGRNFNVPVGTCVDTHVVHPRDMDFYLVSHASILGTARPTRYRLLHDDNKLTDDELEQLTYCLCHMFSRCNRSVSYPSPTYNAHLAAYRARAYLEGHNITTDQDIDSIQKKITDNISKAYPMFFV